MNEDLIAKVFKNKPIIFLSESALINSIEFVENKLNLKLEDKQQEQQHFQSNLEKPELKKLENQLHFFQIQSLQNEIDEIKEMITKLNEVLEKYI